MHQRSTLNAREHCLIEIILLIYFVAGKYHTTTWSTQCLVCCGCCYVCVWDWALVKSGCYQTCDVCHIYHKDCANLICDLTEALEINRSRICRCTSYDHLWLAFLCDAEHLIIIDKSFVVDTVRYDVEILT